MTDYKKVIRSFINFQDKEGFKLVAACDGEEQIKNPSKAEAADWVCQCEGGSLTFEKDGWYINAYAVLGNEEYCTIADSSWKSEIQREILKDFDDAWD